MKKDVVIFRKFPEGDIIVLFPDRVENKDKHYINSYQHVGQHGEASVELITDLEIPTNRETWDLRWELINLGYDIAYGESN